MTLPQSSSVNPADDLRGLMTEHALTQRDIALMACVSIKTVESWLADPGAAMRRKMPVRHIRLIRHTIPQFIAARRGRKAPK